MGGRDHVMLFHVKNFKERKESVMVTVTRKL